MKRPLFLAISAVMFIPAVIRAHDAKASRDKLVRDLFDSEVVLERLKRAIPPAFDISAERNAINSLARKAELSSVEVKDIAGADDGPAVPIVMHRVEIAGQGEYGAIQFFLTMLRHRSRVVGFESVRFDAGKGESVRFVARLLYPSWAPPPTEKEMPSEAALRGRLARNRALAAAIVATVSRLKNSGSAVDALADFTTAVAEQAITLTSARIDDGISIEGLVLGSAARASLPASLKKANLRASKMEWSPAGGCQAFVVKATSERTGESEGLVPGGAIFDAESAAFCRGEPKSQPRRIVARGPVSKDANAFFLRLRDVDAIDVFYVLNDLVAENFVVDQDVKGRIDLDILEGATVDDAFGALRGLGFVIGSAPLRRVSRAAPTNPPPKQSPGGEPINVSIHNADIADILCLLGKISGREVRMPRDLHQRVSLFVTELPVGVALDALLPSSSAADVNPCVLAVPSRSRLARFPLTLEQFVINDLRLAGLARVGDSWKAYVYVPTKGLMALEPDQRLFGETVKSIGPKGVTVVSEAKGAIEIPFLP